MNKEQLIKQYGSAGIALLEQLTDQEQKAKLQAVCQKLHYKISGTFLDELVYYGSGLIKVSELGKWCEAI